MQTLEQRSGGSKIRPRIGDKFHPNFSAAISTEWKAAEVSAADRSHFSLSTGCDFRPQRPRTIFGFCTQLLFSGTNPCPARGACHNFFWLFRQSGIQTQALKSAFPHGRRPIVDLLQ
jgi:hypothetical protein